MRAAFLSSLYRGRGEFRRQVYETGMRLGGVYVDEQPHMRMRPDLEAMDELLSEIRSSQLFICVLGGPEHGTAIDSSRVSFFEIEMYQAALLKRDALVISFDGFDPHPELEEVLRFVKHALPQESWTVVGSDREALRIIEEELERRAGSLNSSLLGRRLQLRRYVTRMWRSRAAEAELREGATPLRFLDGEPALPRSPRTSDLERWLERAGGESNEERRLARLWIAYREVAGAPFTDVRNQEYLPVWDEVLSGWAKAAAWYGLHGHMPLGRLAALKSLEDVRRVMRDSPRWRSSDIAVPPSGALASGHYSIAKLLTDPRGRSWHFDEARRHVELGLKHGHQSRDGLLEIRGSIHLRTGHPWAAARDYERVLRIRDDRGGEPSEIGGALTELGFARLFTGRFRNGRDLITRGLELLEGSADRGFVLRAKRKLRVACLLTGRWREARLIRGEVQREAAERAMWDQDKLL